MKRVVSLIALAAFAASTSNVFAENIFSNPINTAVQTANPFTDGQTFHPNITVSGIGHGPGVTPNTATGGSRYNMQNWAATFDPDDYFTFTLTPNPGYEIDFNNLTGAWQRSGTGPNSFVVMSSLDSFGAAIASGSITGNGSEVAIPTIDLSSLQDVTSAIEIRVYAFGNGAATGTFSFNSFTFDGAVNEVGVNPGGLTGDFNEDGVVDAGDYVTWAKNFDTNNPLANDNGLGTPISTAHYDLWRANYGNPEAIGSGSGLSSGTTVPEPAAVVQFLTILVGLTMAGVPARQQRRSQCA